jgi:hypothetical protein
VSVQPFCSDRPATTSQVSISGSTTTDPADAAAMAALSAAAVPAYRGHGLLIP